MSGGGADEGESFARLVGKVRRLQHDGAPLERPRPPPVPRHAPAAEPLPDELRAAAPDAALAAPSSYQRSGVQRGVLRRLQRGHYAVEDELDLHGMTVRDAARRLAAFLAGARRERVSCVRIIHGKGLSSPGMQPVLKPQVQSWLCAHEAVLAYTPARDRDGGSGALYALLRSRSTAGIGDGGNG